MKKLFLILLATALIPTVAQANLIPVHDGSLHPFSGVYEHEFSNPLPATFYGTTIEAKPGFWDYVSSGGYMLFLWGMANNDEGCMTVFQDYILGTEYVYSFENIPVTQPPAVPIPPPVILLGTGLAALGLFRGRVKK